MKFRSKIRQAWLIPQAEALAGILALTGFFVYFYGRSSLIYPRFHPFLVVVLLVAARYGFVPGLSAALMGGLDYYLLILWRDHWDSALPGEFSFLWPSVFLFSGMIVGELRDREGRKYRELEERYLKERDTARTATLELDLLIKAKKELEKRIFLEPNMASDLFDVFRSLEKDQPDSMPSTLLSLCTAFAGADSVGLYRYGREGFNLEAVSGIHDIPQTVDHGYPPFHQAFEKREPVTIRNYGDLPPPGGERTFSRSPLGVYPVHSRERRVEFLLVIWHAPFEKLTPDFFQMLGMIADRASSRLEFLESTQKTRESVSIDESTGFLRPVYFARRAAEELGKAFRYHTDLSLLEISFASDTGSAREVRPALSAIREVITRLLRDVDFSGFSGDDLRVFVCLPHTSGEGARVVERKFLLHWGEVLGQYPGLGNLPVDLRSFSFSSDGPEEAVRILYRNLMRRLDGVFRVDPSTGFLSGDGFFREFTKEKAGTETVGAPVGLIQARFTAPSRDDVVKLGTFLRDRLNPGGKPFLPESAMIGVPLEGDSLWILFPRIDTGLLQAVLEVISELWKGEEMPRVKRGGFFLHSQVLDPALPLPVREEPLRSLADLSSSAEGIHP